MVDPWNAQVVESEHCGVCVCVWVLKHLHPVIWLCTPALVSPFLVVFLLL